MNLVLKKSILVCYRGPYNKLSLNVEKTKCMTLHTSQKKHSTVTALNRWKTYRKCEMFQVSRYII